MRSITHKKVINSSSGLPTLASSEKVQRAALRMTRDLENITYKVRGWSVWKEDNLNSRKSQTGDRAAKREYKNEWTASVTKKTQIRY